MGKSLKLTFLGTGTSTGVPQLRCGCEVCRSADPRDCRMRTSAMVEMDGKRLLIDCGPDFYHQMRRYTTQSEADNIDALLITHQHYDHVGGLDDIRPFCYTLKKKDNGEYDVKPKPFPIYCQEDVAHDLRERMPYSFSDHPYPGAPTFEVHVIEPYKHFDVQGIGVLPVQVNHAIIEIVGFRIGALAYITDAKKVPGRTIEAIKGVDTLVINALRLKPHPSHMSLSETLEVIEKVKPRRAYLTHISHQLGLHSKVEPTLPANVRIAYDGLTISVPNSLSANGKQSH